MCYDVFICVCLFFLFNLSLQKLGRGTEGCQSLGILAAGDLAYFPSGKSTTSGIYGELLGESKRESKGNVFPAIFSRNAWSYFFQIHAEISWGAQLWCTMVYQSLAHPHIWRVFVLNYWSSILGVQDNFDPYPFEHQLSQEWFCNPGVLGGWTVLFHGLNRWADFFDFVWGRCLFGAKAKSSMPFPLFLLIRSLGLEFHPSSFLSTWLFPICPCFQPHGTLTRNWLGGPIHFRRSFEASSLAFPLKIHHDISLISSDAPTTNRVVTGMV